MVVAMGWPRGDAAAFARARCRRSASTSRGASRGMSVRPVLVRGALAREPRAQQPAPRALQESMEPDAPAIPSPPAMRPLGGATQRPGSARDSEAAWGGPGRSRATEAPKASELKCFVSGAPEDVVLALDAAMQKGRRVWTTSARPAHRGEVFGWGWIHRASQFFRRPFGSQGPRPSTCFICLSGSQCFCFRDWPRHSGWQAATAKARARICQQHASSLDFGRCYSLLAPAVETLHSALVDHLDVMLDGSPEEERRMVGQPLATWRHGLPGGANAYFGVNYTPSTAPHPPPLVLARRLGVQSCVEVCHQCRQDLSCACHASGLGAWRRCERLTRDQKASRGASSFHGLSRTAPRHLRLRSAAVAFPAGLLGLHALLPPLGPRKKLLSGLFLAEPAGEAGPPRVVHPWRARLPTGRRPRSGFPWRPHPAWGLGTGCSRWRHPVVGPNLRETPVGAGCIPGTRVSLHATCPASGQAGTREFVAQHHWSVVIIWVCSEHLGERVRAAREASACSATGARPPPLSIQFCAPGCVPAPSRATPCPAPAQPHRPQRLMCSSFLHKPFGTCLDIFPYRRPCHAVPPTLVHRFAFRQRDFPIPTTHVMLSPIFFPMI